jgi:hypothetical protein
MHKCEKEIKFTCEYCQNEFTQKDNLKRHLLTCKMYEYDQLLKKENEKNNVILLNEKKKYEEIINSLIIENEKLKNKIEILKEDKETLLLKIFEQKTNITNNTDNSNTNNIDNSNNTININITTEDYRVNNLKITDITGYQDEDNNETGIGIALAKYVLKSTEIPKKIKLRDKSRKLIEYFINDIKYYDKGLKFVHNTYKTYYEQILYLLQKTYNKNNDLDINIYQSKFMTLLKNVRDNELKEIVDKEKTNNSLSQNLLNTIIENLSK